MIGFYATLLLFHGNVLECFLQQGPERIYRWDVCALDGGVGRLHRRSERHHVEVRIFAENDRAFESCVVNLYDAVLVEQFFVFFQQQVEHF